MNSQFIADKIQEFSTAQASAWSIAHQCEDDSNRETLLNVAEGLATARVYLQRAYIEQVHAERKEREAADSQR